MPDAGNDIRMKRAPLWVVALALVFYGVFTFQMVRSLNIDAFQLSGTRLDILGFWVSVMISCILGLRALMHRYFNFPALLLVLVLIGYVSIVFAFTDVRTPFEAFLISRHGILMWFILGVGVATTLSAFAQIKDGSRDRRARMAILFMMVMGIFAIIDTSIDYIADPVLTENYQPAAATAITLLIFLFLTSKAAWSDGVPKFINVLLLLGAGFLIAAVALMQSTLIVLFGALFVANILYGMVRDSRYKAVSVGVVIFGLVMIFDFYGDAIENIVARTRFSELLGVDKGFSPLDNRINLLSTFIDQFEVSPIFGNFNAENLSYAGEGFYIHSLPLSFLTHSGIVGFALFLFVLYFSLMSRLKGWNFVTDTERSALIVFVAVLAIGTVATFFTWPVFWLMLGIASMKPVLGRGKKS